MGIQNTTNRRTRRRLAVIMGSVTTAVVIAAAGLCCQLLGNTPPSVHSAIHVTSVEAAQWRHDTATPFQRGAIVSKIREAFAGVADVGVLSQRQEVAAAVAAGTQSDSPVVRKGTPVAQEDLAFGVTGDHFWVIASYADLARGDIALATGACVAYGVPWWLCSSIGGIFTEWASGWGQGNQHGVWLAVYWWPPHIVAGRW